MSHPQLNNYSFHFIALSQPHHGYYNSHCQHEWNMKPDYNIDHSCSHLGCWCFIWQMLYIVFHCLCASLWLRCLSYYPFCSSPVNIRLQPLLLWYVPVLSHDQQEESPCWADKLPSVRLSSLSADISGSHTSAHGAGRGSEVPECSTHHTLTLISEDKGFLCLSPHALVWS